MKKFFVMLAVGSAFVSQAFSQTATTAPVTASKPAVTTVGNPMAPAAASVAAVQAIDACLAQPAALTLAALDAEHLLLSERLARFDAAADPLAIWAALGIVDVAAIPMLEADAFMTLAATHRLGVPA